MKASAVSGRISADDLSRLFHVVELCSVNPDALAEDNPSASPAASLSSSVWTISEREGYWVPGSSAGGSRKHSRGGSDSPLLHPALPGSFPLFFPLLLL